MNQLVSKLARVNLAAMLLSTSIIENRFPLPLFLLEKNGKEVVGSSFLKLH